MAEFWRQMSYWTSSLDVHTRQVVAMVAGSTRRVPRLVRRVTVRSIAMVRTITLVKAEALSTPKNEIMYRRFLTLLLLPALLLTQWVNSSRCMGGCQSSGQDSRPHVHLTAVLPGTPQAKGCGCQRQRDADVSGDSRLSAALVASDSSAATEQVPGHGAGDNILYLSFDTVYGGRAGAGSIVDLSDDHVLQPAELLGLERWADHLSNHSFLPLVVTPQPDVKCPVYLRVCALLI